MYGMEDLGCCYTCYMDSNLFHHRAMLIFFMTFCFVDAGITSIVCNVSKSFVFGNSAINSRDTTSQILTPSTSSGKRPLRFEQPQT